MRVSFRTSSILSSTTSSDTESDASNLQCVPAPATAVIACAKLGEPLCTKPYVMNLSTELSAIAVMGPEVSPDLTTSRKGVRRRTASRLRTSV